ncbi:MAG: hypothetical protein JRJ12_03895 [Deltaproteobacteria bacterium]|nr:hypothetical protein [Deltaproteobacteria bacterium]MBW2070190.1 hypothetical protein [Deltaproteobacteria bacterium]
MAEIKSTLELVMERTKHLKLSEEEKAEVQMQEALAKVQGLVRQLQDDTATVADVCAQIEALPQHLQARLKRQIARQVCDALSPDQQSEVLVNLLETLLEPSWEAPFSRFRKCWSEYNRLREAEKEKVTNSIVARLAAAGIQGSAVVPKVEDDPAWREQLENLWQPCEQHLAALRQALL